MTPAGTLLTRQADISWLIRRFETMGLRLRKRVAGQFTELYTRFQWSLPRKLIHAFNGLWFRCLKVPHPAFGNLLIFEKK